jgi:hypothetical protein
MATTSSLSCSIEVRDRVKDAKRGGESYDELLLAMLEQYDPSETDNQRVEH